MGQNAPPMPNFQGAAQQQANASQANVGAQTAANRPDITTPFGGQSWQQGPNGQWTMQTGFGGPLGQGAAALGQQAADNYSRPFSLAGIPGLTSGQEARDQAINAAMGQATSRLDPQWQQREEGMRTQLLNQGLTPGSEAYDRAMANLGRERNDAYTSAMNAAIGQGTQAGQALFGQSLAGRQQGVNEAGMQYGMPLSQMQGLQSLLQMPGFNAAGVAETPQLLPAEIAQGNFQTNLWQLMEQQRADQAQGGSKFGSSILQLLPFFL